MWSPKGLYMCTMNEIQYVHNHHYDIRIIFYLIQGQSVWPLKGLYTMNEGVH